MRQVASVISDGTVRYFIVDSEEGSLTEFATIAVPGPFGPEQAIKLGFNLIAAAGLNGHAKRRVGDDNDGAEQPRRRRVAGWDGYRGVARYVAEYPGVTQADLRDAFGMHDQTGVKRVSNAVNGAKTHGLIESRDGGLYPLAEVPEMLGASADRRRAVSPRRHRWSHVTGEAVADYIKAHPGCQVSDIAAALMGEVTPLHRTVISNRLIALRSAMKYGGPVLVTDKTPNPKGGAAITRLSYADEG